MTNAPCCFACSVSSGTGRFLQTQYGGGPRDQAILMDRVDCRGGEQSLFECVYWPQGELSCSHLSDVSVQCDVHEGERRASTLCHLKPGASLASYNCIFCDQTLRIV